MELKVWVDGIQRVVCGANLSTTCQDVVVALAHAMGRTGRFTLIEKWRDVERPLTPGECPLKSLQKWGEYAAEVRFYLMQAEQQEKPPQKSPKQRSAQLAETLEDNFSHDFTPPPAEPTQSSSSSSSKHYQNLQPQNQPQHRHLIPQVSQSVPDSIKRSSTFSGTLNSNYATIPQSNSLHAKLDNLKQQQQQPPPQYHQRSHPQTKQQLLPQQQKQPSRNQPHQNHSGHHTDNNTSQQYQNVVIAPKSQNVRSQNIANQNTPRHLQQQQQQQQQQKPIPIPMKTQNRHNGNLSARSSASSNQSTSPRNIGSQNPNSSSPGRANSTGTGSSVPTIDIISSSPSQDSRYLHPANIPRPSETYSNFPPPNSDHQQQQQQNRSKPSNSSSSTSTTKPVPTPAPRSHQPHPRQQSPSSSVPYENLPPLRRSSSNGPPPSSHPSDNRAAQEPRPPSRKRRERVQSTGEAKNRSENNTQNVIQTEEDPNQWKTGRSNNDKTMVTPQEINQRGGDRLYQKKISDDKLARNKISNSVINNDHNNFSSDLSDDCFQGPDPSSRAPANFQNNNYSKKVINNNPKSSHSKDFPPGSSTKIQKFPPTPQLSQTLPSYSSSSPSRSRSSETAGQRTAKSQTLPPPPTNTTTPERTRRSEGGGRVNFVESALLRQQRSSLDDNNTAVNKNTDQYLAEGQAQHRDSSWDRRRGGDHPPSYAGHSGRRDNSREPADPNSFVSSSSHSETFPEQYNSYNENNYNEEKNFNFTDNFSTQLTNNDSSSPSSSDYHHYNPHHRPQHNPSPQQSPRTSAFKVVSPRSNRPNSLSSSHSPHSPISPSLHETPPIPYSLDNQNFDLPVNLDHHHHQLHPSSSSLSYPEFSSTSPTNNRPHARQASLEIEEYDLDQNFPDISQKGGHGHPYPSQPQHQSSTLPRITGRKAQGQGHTTEYVMDRPGGAPPTSMEPEYMRILRQVKMQQEQLKMMESQADEMDTEISTLETEQSNLDLKLDVVGTELSSLEKMEEKMELELKDLDRVEWVNVLDGEVKCEHDLRSKMSKLRVELTVVENKLGELGEEEKSKGEALKREQQQKEQKEKKEEQEMVRQLTETKGEMSTLESLLRQGEEEMKTLEKGIRDAEEKIKSQEEEADQLEKLLHSENLKEFQSNPVPKEPPPISSDTPTTAATTMTTKITTDIDNNIIITKAPARDPLLSSSSSSSRPTTPRSRPPSETGEAILKILEGRKSPRDASPSPATNEAGSGDDSGANTTSSALHNPLKTTTTLVKNPNGVWV